MARLSGRLGRASLVGGAVAGLYWLGMRPWYLHWGATADEIHRSLPGDALLPRPTAQSTRAITINAPAHAIWPWLVQMGYGRGALYSYDWLENIAGRLAGFKKEFHSVDRIEPDLQDLKSGDKILLGPDMPLFVRQMEPPQALVLSTRDPETGGPYLKIMPDDPARVAMSWAFILQQAHVSQTRLIIRTRGDYRPRGLRGLPLFFMIWPEPAQFIMERKMMQGIKARAERSWWSPREGERLAPTSRPAPIEAPKKTTFG